MNIEIPQHIQDLMEEVWPDSTPRRRAHEVRHLLYEILRAKARQQVVTGGPLLPFETVPAQENPRDIAERVAQRAPAIDDQNWVAIRLGVEQAQSLGLWENTENERRLIEQLNVDFDNARNEFRVQKSRITAFFSRLL